MFCVSVSRVALRSAQLNERGNAEFNLHETGPKDPVDTETSTGEGDYPEGRGLTDLFIRVMIEINVKINEDNFGQIFGVNNGVINVAAQVDNCLTDIFLTRPQNLQHLYRSYTHIKHFRQAWQRGTSEDKSPSLS